MDNKPDKPITFFPDDGMRERLTQSAAEDHRSLSGQIRVLIAEALDAREAAGDSTPN